jgi:N-acetylglucosamine kinase-like BadF-type ATPase
VSFFLAVDAGGTKTDFVLADETRELARVRTGTIKRMRADAETTGRNLDTALAELSASSGVAMSAITHTCIGTAGETVPLVVDWLREAFAARVGGSLLLLGDVEIALDAAFPGGAGVLALAGTGSNVAGRGADGVVTTAGGMGPMLADQGSGHRIGYEGLRAAFLARDEGRETVLMDEVLAFWELRSIDLLVEHANHVPPPDFSRLAGLVVRAAAEGDAVAQEVLAQQGEELGYLVRLIVRRIRVREPEWVPRIGFAGSIMEKVMPVRSALVEAVRREFPGTVALDGVVDPIAGALWRARNGR